MADAPRGAPSRSGRLVRLLDELGRSLWLWPALAGILAAAAAEALVRIDRSLDPDGAVSRAAFGGDAGAARAVLSAIAGASMTVLGVTISLTLAVLALTAQGYTPRVITRFMRDRGVQAVVAVLIASFTFSLATLRLVRADEVPGIAVNVSVLLALTSLAVLVGFFHHLASEIRVERVIARSWEDARGPIDAMHPATGDEPRTDDLGPPVTEFTAARTGRVVWIEEPRLIRAARACDCTLVVVPPIGSFVCEGEPLVRSHGGREPDSRQRQAILAAVHLGTQRTSAGDPAFGLRQLTDIALRALSPGVNDATTAHEAIMRCADLLRRLADRDLGLCARDDPGDDGRPGAIRVLRLRPDWDDLVGLVVDQVAAGAESQADAATTLVLLDALGRVAAASDDPARLAVLRERARRLRDGAHRAITEPRELERIDRVAEPLI